MPNEVKYLKIKNNLFFNILYVKELEEKEIVVEPQNQFLIFDRSYSMSYYLDELVDVAIKYCKKLPDGSTVSLGYFSGSNQYNLSVPYTLKKEESGVVTTLNTFKNPIGLTCFNQILNKLNETASRTKGKSSLYFFTDGCHNTGGSKKDIEQELVAWTQHAQVTMFVGYGWIDRDIMSWMAATTDGSFVHLNDFSQFEQTLADFGIAVEDSSPVVPVEILTNESVVPISFSGKSIIEYNVVDRIANFKPSKSGFKGLFFITKSPISGAQELTTMDITAERGIRGLAYTHSQKNEVDVSLELLSYIGDKHLIQKLFNSIAPEEYSIAEDATRRSIFSPQARFLEGKAENFLPDPDAFCVLDAINILAQDDTAKMYTRDKDFNYVRIGKSLEQLDGSEIKYPDDSFVYLNNIVMNKERLNLSISTSTTGTVSLDPKNFKDNPFTKEDLKKHDLPEDYPVTIFRTYTIIADGRLQTKQLVVSDLSKETIEALSSIITMRNDKKYIIDLTTLPIINKTYVKMTSGKVLATNVWEEKVLTDQLSVYRYYKKKAEEILGKVSLKESALSEEAAQFLVNHCYIKNETYNPPFKAVVGNDEYDAYKFDIKIKGFTKVTASAVIKKLDVEGKTTERERIVKEAYRKYNNSKEFALKRGSEFKKQNEKALSNIEDAIAKLTKQLKKVRKFIQLSKFAIILGNNCKIDEFDSRENMSLTITVPTLTDEQVPVEFQFNIEKTTIQI